jgi:hypothetical protein
VVLVKLLVTRDNVAASDDLDAPHRVELEGPSREDIEAAIAIVVASGYLPHISGGRATWSVSSGRILAVIAQQWPAPRLLWGIDRSYRGLDIPKGTLRLHFSYHMQQAPEMVLDVLNRVRLHAIE